MSVDPLSPDYPELTPYQYASNTPIQAIDLDGLEMYYAADGEYLGKYGKSTQIRIIAHEEMIQDAKTAFANPRNTDPIVFESLLPSFSLRLTESAQIHKAGREAASNVLLTIFNDDVSPKKDAKTMWATEGNGKRTALLQTYDQNTIAYSYEKTYNEELLLDDYYNVFNGLYHESFHQSENKANSKSAISYPFDHFDIGISQVQNSSFKQTTDNFQSYTKEVLGIYLNQQEKRLGNNTGDSRFDSLYKEYQNNTSLYNDLFKESRETKEF